MKRLILTLAAALLVAGPLSYGEAFAQGKQGGRWEQRGDRGGDRGGGRWRVEDRGGPDRPRGDDLRGGEGRGPRWERPRSSDDDRRPPPGAYGVRRGGYLPPQAEGRPVEQPSQLRLRTPPRGYSWVRVPGGYALVDQRTGQIFDMVPTR